METKDCISRAEAEELARKQVSLAWMQTGISIVVGWGLAQLNLHAILPRIFG
jgi:hypothetical protein